MFIAFYILFWIFPAAVIMPSNGMGILSDSKEVDGISLNLTAFSLGAAIGFSECRGAGTGFTFNIDFNKVLAGGVSGWAGFIPRNRSEGLSE